MNVKTCQFNVLSMMYSELSSVDVGCSSHITTFVITTCIAEDSQRKVCELNWAQSPYVGTENSVSSLFPSGARNSSANETGRL